MEKIGKAGAVIQITSLGVLSATLYFLLYYFEDPILNWSTKPGDWYFIVPVIIAFVFSFIHGAFTSHFWNVLGVKAKSIKK